MRASPSFAASSIGARPAFASASPARHRLSAGVRLALADEDEREMRERREIAARAQRPARGHHRQHAGPSMSTRSWTSSRRTPDVPLRERVRAEQHRRPHDLVRERLADAAGVAANEVQLELGGLPRVDVDVHEAPEAGVHAVCRPLVPHDPLDQRPRGVDLAQRVGRERDRHAVQRDALDVVDGEVVPGELDRRHVRREGYRSPRPNSPAAATSSMRSGASPGRRRAAPAAEAATEAGMRPTSSPRTTAAPCSAASRSTSRTTR